ncbi:MAG: ATP synthase F0 subunit B, partial [Prosthecobacter sp.]|uniref:F0F1 ATP synthase subunit B family protein n=2 Tax=Prosthecobacter sp. TaxID=1965333 RepID=UPI003BAF0997
VMDQIKGIAYQIAGDFGLAWGKFFAQVIIFILVYTVLKKYAFGPIMGMLEQRRQRIADGEAKLEKITRDAAEAAKNSQAILDKAEADAARLVKEADDAAKLIQERRQQEAVSSANTIIAKAREAAQLEQEQLMSQLKREFGRMVSDATSRVTGKVLNSEDQSRINQETSAQVSA